MTIPSQRKYDFNHHKSLDTYSNKLRAAYIAALNGVSKLAVNASLNSNAEFYFRSNPTINNEVNKLMNGLYDSVYGTTVSGINTEWALGVEKNNELAHYAFGESIKDIPASYRNKYLSNNNTARRNFLYRKDNGLTLSNKVWNNTRQFKQELELALEAGIGSGKSAASIARDVKEYLNDPEKLFRRIREKPGGVLRLSKAAKSYHPGQGRYRSSYKNALRLTRNETNFSYEGSQTEKRKQQDFIVGVEIRVSPQHVASSDKGGISCLNLQGKYPKDFDFTYKWHVNCLCLSLNILKTREELDKDVDRILAGKEPIKTSKNQVTGLPSSYNSYLTNNAKKWEKWQNKPRTFTLNKELPKSRAKKTTTTPKAAPKQKTITAPKKPEYSAAFPEGLKSDSKYAQGIVFDNNFFRLLDPNKTVTLRTAERGEGSYFLPFKNLVHIVDDNRSKFSPWHRESVIYHEYGHAIDYARGLNYEITEWIDRLRKEMNKASKTTITGSKYDYKTGTYKPYQRKVSIIKELDWRTQELGKKFWNMKPETFTKLGITKKDAMEQLGALRDTIMSINPSYGGGHSKAYFKKERMRQKEFLAHAFENKFAGNVIFKKLMPELYDDMIKYIDNLKPMQ